MPNGISIVATSRYLYVSRVDGSLLSRHLTVEDAIEAAVNAGPGDYRITYPDRLVKVYGTIPSSPVPTAPTALTLEDVTGGYVSLSWTDDGNGTSWTVYRDGAPVGTAASSYYTDATVVPSTLYSYQVQASNSSGSSTLSDALAVTTSANSLPSWSLTDQSGTIGTAFSLNLNTECDDVDGHTLAFTLTSGSVPGLSLTSPNYSGTPTTAGAYPLTFRANDGYGTADTSITFNVYDPDVTAPTVPSGFSASANGSTVTVTWAESTDASGVATYRVYRGGVFRALSSASPYVESGVPVGSYSYTVSAVDSSANANESAQSTVAPVTVVPQTPDTPTSFTATSSGTTINLSWAAGPNGAAPDDYDLDYSTVSASGPWTSIPIGLVTTYAHTGRTAGVTYYYQVKAKLGALESGYAAASCTASAIKWNPGHYFQLFRSPEWQSFSLRQPKWASIASESSVKGGSISYTWGQLEPTQGAYDFSQIYADLNYAAGLSTPKRLWIRINENPYNWVRTDTRYWPAWAAAISSPYQMVYNVTATRSHWRRWNSTFMGYYIDLIEALGAEFDSHPYVEGISLITETAFGAAPADYTPSADITQLTRLCTAALAAWPTTNLKMSINWHNDITGLISSVYGSGRILFGGPDITNPYDSAYDIDGMRYHMGYYGGTDYRNLAGYAAGIEASELGYNSVGPTGGYTPAQLWSYANGYMHASHLMWDWMDSSTNPAQNWSTGILPFIRSNPTPTYSTKPSNYT